MGIFKKLLKVDDALVAETPQSTPSSSSEPVPGLMSVAAATRRADDLQLLSSIIRKPVVTEKSSLLGRQNKYVFVVQHRANKFSVAVAIEKMYGVRPVAVRIINMPGKERIRGRIKGRISGWKKAIVTLPVGKTIKIAEGN
jgi:large subunit ribosomal protein L23